MQNNILEEYVEIQGKMILYGGTVVWIISHRAF